MCSTLLERPLGVKLSKPFSRTTPNLFSRFEGRIPADFFPPVFQSRLLFSRCKEVHLNVAHLEPRCYFTMRLFFLTI